MNTKRDEAGRCDRELLDEALRLLRESVAEIRDVEWEYIEVPGDDKLRRLREWVTANKAMVNLLADRASARASSGAVTSFLHDLHDLHKHYKPGAEDNAAP